MAFNINDLGNLDPLSPEYSTMKKRMGQQQQFPGGPPSSPSSFDNPYSANQFLSSQNMGGPTLSSPNADILQQMQQSGSSLGSQYDTRQRQTEVKPEPSKDILPKDTSTNSVATPPAAATPTPAPAAVTPAATPVSTPLPSVGNGQQMPPESDAEEINSLNARRSKLIDQLAAYPQKIDPRTGKDLNGEIRNHVRSLIEEVQKQVGAIHQKHTMAARAEMDATNKAKAEQVKADKFEKAKAIVLAQHPGLKDHIDNAVLEKATRQELDRQRLSEARANAPSKEETAHNARVAEQDKAAGTELGKRQSTEDFVRGRRSDYDKKAYALAANGEITQDDLQRILSRPPNHQAMDAIFAQKTGVFTNSGNGANQRGQNPGAFVPPTDTTSTPRPGATSPQIQLNDPGLAPLQDDGSLQPAGMAGPPRPLEQTQRIGSSAERMADIMKPRRPKKV